MDIQNDAQFDRILRFALLDAQRADLAAIMDADADALPTPPLSPRYLRWEARLLNDPFGFAKKRIRPMWQRALRAAVWMLVAAGVALGGLWLTPSTRAWVEQYIFRRGAVVDEYRFQGDGKETEGLGKIRPGYVPEGFVETEASEFMGDWHVTYQDERGSYIHFSVLAAVDGKNLSFDNEHSILSDITVNGWRGQLYTATSSAFDDYLVLSDENMGCIYFFSSNTGTDVLIQMAETIGAV